FLCNVISLPTRLSISRLGASDNRCTNVPALFATFSPSLSSTWGTASLADVNFCIFSPKSISDGLSISEGLLALFMIRTHLHSIRTLYTRKHPSPAYCLFVVCL